MLSQELPVDEEPAAALVTYAARLVRATRRQSATDVPAAALRLLSQLDELGPSSVSRLALADRCSQPTMSSAVQSIVERGWARRESHPDDARSSLVGLTPDGDAVLAAARERNAAVISARLAETGRSTDDLAAAVSLLRDLLDHPPTEG